MTKTRDKWLAGHSNVSFTSARGHWHTVVRRFYTFLDLRNHLWICILSQDLFLYVRHTADIGFSHQSRPKFYEFYACDFHVSELDRDLTTFFAG